MTFSVGGRMTAGGVNVGILLLEHHPDVAAAEQKAAHGVTASDPGPRLHGILPDAGAGLYDI